MVYSQWILRRWAKTLDSLSCKWRKLLVTQNMCLVKLKVIVKKLGKNWNNCLNCFSNFYVKLKYVNFISIFHVKVVKVDLSQIEKFPGKWIAIAIWREKWTLWFLAKTFVKLLRFLVAELNAKAIWREKVNSSDFV